MSVRSDAPAAGRRWAALAAVLSVALGLPPIADAGSPSVWQVQPVLSPSIAAPRGAEPRARALAPEAAGFIDERGREVDGADTPSRARTLLYSALLPGLGQLRQGHQGAGIGFILGEIASWTSFFTFHTQGELRKDRYIEYAERFAGVADASGRDNDYYQALARYPRSDPGPGSYNEIEVRLVAQRELFPDDPEAQARYIAENSITGELAWDWETEERRLQFARIRSSSESAFHRSDFAIGGLIAGRILSVMHAVWLTSDRGSGGDEEDETDDPGVDHGLARALGPYFKANVFDDEYRIGVRTRF